MAVVRPKQNVIYRNVIMGTSALLLSARLSNYAMPTVMLRAFIELGKMDVHARSRQ